MVEVNGSCPVFIDNTRGKYTLPYRVFTLDRGSEYIFESYLDTDELTSKILVRNITKNEY